MPRKTYGWEDGTLPIIAPHSLAKHRILRGYVERYLQVLTSSAPGADRFRITLVDGFAGGGEYQDKEGQIFPGSPLILIEAVERAQASLNQVRTKPLFIDSRFVFVEKAPAVAAYLRDVLERRGERPGVSDRVTLLEGTFESHLSAIIGRVKERGRAHRAIIVLDQYGYTGVPLEAMQRIFAELPKAEVFLTLAVGWILAYLPDARTVAERLGIPPCELARLSALNEDGLDIDNPDRRLDLLTVQRILHHTFTHAVGSAYYTPFFIVSRESHRAYWFLHMANSSRAHDVVKELHWSVENHFEHFGGAGLTMLGYDPKCDPLVTGQTAFRFDDLAKVRTEAALSESLAARIACDFPDGIEFANLFATVCNETPATSGHLAASVNALCIAGELEKTGENGERRAATTLPHAADRIRLARQRRLFVRG